MLAEAVATVASITKSQTSMESVEGGGSGELYQHKIDTSHVRTARNVIVHALTTLPKLDPYRFTKVASFKIGRIVLTGHHRTTPTIEAALLIKYKPTAPDDDDKLELMKHLRDHNHESVNEPLKPSSSSTTASPTTFTDPHNITLDAWTWCFGLEYVLAAQDPLSSSPTTVETTNDFSSGYSTTTTAYNTPTSEHTSRVPRSRSRISSSCSAGGGSVQVGDADGIDQCGNSEDEPTRLVFRNMRLDRLERLCFCCGGEAFRVFNSQQK
ncbi:hypothetical protein HDU76_004121 [Blyttiomyces sp. JEL0837]|nr:hypothetical protein HDU76_004121 [Blyttiomyces sp. JEL0837]